MPAPWLLLTGFEPFGGDAVNPSWELAQRMDGEMLGGWRVRALCLPCSFAAAPPALAAALAGRPSAVLSLGLAGSRSALSVERVAVNLMDARIPDNAGLQPVDEAIVPGGPAARFSRLPVKAMVHAARQAGVPAELSFSAGSFVCNQVFYQLLHALRRRPLVPAGFVHVPWATGMGPAGGEGSALPLDEQLRGLRAMLACVVAGGPERRDIGGTIS
jgi:pyroglutamyl-peptidase